MLSLIGKKVVKVTPSNTVNIKDENSNDQIGSLYVGTGGDVVILPWYNGQTDSASTTGVGGAQIFKNVPDGSFLPIVCSKVFATGTTATDILAIID
jgi:hypothetical protein